MPFLVGQGQRRKAINFPGNYHQSFPEFSGLPGDDKGGSGESTTEKVIAKSSLANYHPVLNVSFLGKVVEWAVTGKVFWKNTLALDPFQAGFQPGPGMVTALGALTNDFHRELD